MTIECLSVPRIPGLIELMRTGAPYISVRSQSDYWAYATLFSSTCPLAVLDEVVAAAVVAFRSQDEPNDIYVQDVVVHPEHRGKGLAAQLLDTVRDYGIMQGCRRIYLTSEPGNISAHRAWIRYGFVNLPGHREENGIEVTRDFKGPGKDRAVYELNLE